MNKKITVTLSEKAEQYLNELLYSLTGKDDKPATQSECISESLETLAMFEDKTENQLRNWIVDFDKLPDGAAKSFASNPVEEPYDEGAPPEEWLIEHTADDVEKAKVT